MKTVLLLGGSAQQLDSFDAAERLGYRTVLCDWDPVCPGRARADSFHEVSTLDREAVLEVARAENVDGVVSFASDAPAPVAAWVSDQLDLPGNPPNAVSMMCDKGLFRAFLAENGFAAPANVVVRTGERVGFVEIISKVGLPCVVKPVDSAGSRGVSVVWDGKDLPDALDRAFGFSRKGEAVVEQFVEPAPGGRIEAELFIEDGRVVSWGLMDTYRDDTLNGVVPSCCVHPMSAESAVGAVVRETLLRMTECAGIVQGAMNVEVLVDGTGKVYVVDVGPRNGGNYLPAFFSHVSGDDIVEATLRIACGESSGLKKFEGATDGLWIQHMHYSRMPGVFRGLQKTEDYERACLETHLYMKVGSEVEPLSCAGDCIGVSLLHFPEEHDADALVPRLEGMCRVVVERAKE